MHLASIWILDEVVDRLVQAANVSQSLAGRSDTINAMEKQELLEIVAKVLEVDPSSLSFDADLKERNWDSLANVMLIAELDDLLGITLSSDELKEAETVADIHALVLVASA